MRRTSYTIRVVLALIMTMGALILAGGQSKAQVGTAQDLVPVIGAGGTTTTFAGGSGIDYTGSAPIMRPHGAPNDSEFSAAVEFETWKTDVPASIVRGNRQTILAGYSKARANDEIVAILPYQFLHVNGFLNTNHLDDSEITYRRYSFDATDPSSTTVVYGAKLILPTGDVNKRIGLGRWGLAPTVTVSKPCGKSLYYIGGNYTFLEKKSGDPYASPYFIWIGGVTQLQPKTSLQYEATKFRSASGGGVDYFRILVGPRFQITPTAGIQVNLKQELQAGSKSTVISIGYSRRM